MICIRDIIVCLHFTRCIGYVGGVCVPTLQYAVSESKYYMYMTNSDDVQILDYICWQKCVMRPEEFSNVWHECSESKDYGIPIAACLCVSAFSWIRLLRSGSGTMQRRSALKEFPFDLESTLLPQTHIFTVWMNLNFCVCTLLNTLAGSFLTCVVLSKRVHTHTRKRTVWVLRLIAALGCWRHVSEYRAKRFDTKKCLANDKHIRRTPYACIKCRANVTRPP